MSPGKKASKPKLIADSKILAEGTAGFETVEFELAMIIFWHTFSRWVERCGQAAGIEGLSTFDLLVLHFLRVRQRSMRAADIAFALSIEDQHLVSYAIRKLIRKGLLKGTKIGKEIVYAPTEESEKSFERYVGLRQRFLISSIEMIQNPGYELPALAKTLRALSGIYEQAARAATSE